MTMQKEEEEEGREEGKEGEGERPLFFFKTLFVCVQVHTDACTYMHICV